MDQSGGVPLRSFLHQPATTRTRLAPQTMLALADVDGGDEEDLVPPKGVLGWLPLLALSLFLFLGNVGYGTLIWVVTAELLPPKARFTSCHAFLCPVMMLETILDA